MPGSHRSIWWWWEVFGYWWRMNALQFGFCLLVCVYCKVWFLISTKSKSYIRKDLDFPREASVPIKKLGVTFCSVSISIDLAGHFFKASISFLSAWCRVTVKEPSLSWGLIWGADSYSNSYKRTAKRTVKTRLRIHVSSKKFLTGYG